MVPEIKIKEGLGPITFSCTTEKVRDIFGDPPETEELDSQFDGSLESIIWSYPDEGLNFFFDATGDQPVLTTIESCQEETQLFGARIFDMTPARIIELMKNNGYDEAEEEEETWGERRVTFDKAQLDFYFEDDELNMVSWSSF